MEEMRYEVSHFCQDCLQEVCLLFIILFWQVWLLREGVGVASNNVAEYRAVILGLRTALQKGFKHVKVRGDSLLVCNQVFGLFSIYLY